MYVIITFEVPVYKDRTKNPKKFIRKELASNVIDEKTKRVREDYSYLGSVYIEQICVFDGEKLNDVTEKYTKCSSDKKTYVNGIIRNIFSDYKIEW